jgi:hypothetical protein
MPDDSFPDHETVTSREDFAAFVDQLRSDLAIRPDEWENPTLDAFLEALSAYTRAVPGYITNVRSELHPDQPSWQLFALILSGARVYE